MTRFVPLIVLVVLAAGRVASAQTLPNGAELVFEDLEVFDGTEFFEPEATLRRFYFNLPHCTCARAQRDTFRYRVRQTVDSGIINRPVEFWVGETCADQTVRNMNCKEVKRIGDIKTLYPGGSVESFSLFDVVNGKLHEAEACQEIEGAATIWVFVRTQGGSGEPDFKATIDVGSLAGEMTAVQGVDTRPPPGPEGLSARPSEEAINLTWTAPSSSATDVAYYQALCATADDTPARSAAAERRYVTTGSICPGVAPPPREQLIERVLDNGEMAVPLPTGDFGGLDERFICGEAPGTATGLQIEGLQNGTPYRVILLSMDLHGNFTGTYLANTITPRPVTDFWEDLHDRGSEVEGGLCLLAETYGGNSALTSTLRAFRDQALGGSRLGRWLTDTYYATTARLAAYVHDSTALRILAAVLLSPPVMFALLWHWLTLPGALGLIAVAWWLVRSRRLVRRWIVSVLHMRSMHVAAGLAVLLSSARQADAGGYQPYWETQDPAEDEQALAGPETVRWQAGIRLGPYIPDIDKQIGMDPGPYEQMFGGYRVLPMLDVDRILFTHVGQVGVGISLGYMQKTARAFVMNSDPSNPDRPREPGAENTFRLIPFALTATYRFTQLDDNYGIPVVPYVRGGLSYYVWWVNAPNGDLSKVCDDGGMQPDCSQNKALGGSLGYQGSIGLAIRAERVDASAAMSMRQSGIQHAGVYGELSIANVDGFGSASKLSVGDRTWFAGVNFEF